MTGRLVSTCLRISAEGERRTDGDVSDESLLNDTAELLDLKRGLVPVAVRLGEDLERVGPVAGASPLVLDRVRGVRVDLVNDLVDRVLDEELPGVDLVTRGERAVRVRRPLGMHFHVHVSSTALKSNQKVSSTHEMVQEAVRTV